MRLRFVLGLLTVMMQLAARPAAAATLNLSGDRYWIVLASRRTLDEAIALARIYSRSAPKVVRSSAGWFGVVRGPQTLAPGSGRSALDALIRNGDVPKDAYLSRGETYEDLVWSYPADPALKSVAYGGVKAVTLQIDDLTVTLSRHGTGDKDIWDPTFAGTVGGKPAFTAALTDNGAELPASAAEVLVLDKASASPQVVFTYFWQGAHCCTVTRMATRLADGSWTVVDGETLDGGGYGFEDLAGTGEQQLISSDNSFLYAFDSYAGSVAPVAIHRLAGKRLLDVTTDPRFRHRLLQDLYAIESLANADSWHSTGFLAGWVAAKIRVGQGQDAWSRMMAGYADNADFPPQRCLVGKPLEQCPDDKKATVPFPIALRQFLVDRGYIDRPGDYPVPDHLALKPAVAAP